MFGTIRDVMTPDPLTLDAGMPIRDAARAMRDFDVGDIVVAHPDGSIGIVTDRDLVIRALAEGADPETAPIGGFSSDDLVTVSPDDSINAALELIRGKAVRRVLVLSDGRLAGTTGDLAKRVDPASMLAAISFAPANH
jgi:CBS domain-containing protein